MNKRINELAFEANKDLDGNVPIGFAEKFAELVAKDVLDQLEELTDHINAAENNPLLAEFQTPGAGGVSTGILKHIKANVYKQYGIE
jgi:hypothetical protein